MAQPGMYSMELSLLVMEAGIKLLRERRPELLYLSLTDWVQHKWAPVEDGAREFYRRLDDCVGRLAALDATIALTADHGMSDKSTAHGEPQVLWLQDHLDTRLGTDTTTVVCPITDAFVAHHGALGGFVRVCSRGTVTPRQILDAIGDGRAWNCRRPRDGLPGIRPPGGPRRRRRRDRAPTLVHRERGPDHDFSRTEGPSPAHARRHRRGKSAAHPARPLNDAYRYRPAIAPAQELAGLRLRDQRHAVSMGAGTGPSQSEGDVNPRRAARRGSATPRRRRAAHCWRATAPLFLHQCVSTPCLTPIAKAEGI